MDPGLRFARVYAKRMGAAGRQLSGPLASAEVCAPLIGWLNSQAEEGMRSVLDLGCGDLGWISQCEAIVERRLSYTGVDAVRPLISHHARVFPWFRGYDADIEVLLLTGKDERGTRRALAADVVILKEVLEFECPGMVENTLAGMARMAWRRLVVSHTPGSSNRSRGGLREGVAQMPLDVEALSATLQLEFGRPLERFPRPGGGEWLIFER